LKFAEEDHDPDMFADPWYNPGFHRSRLLWFLTKNQFTLSCRFYDYLLRETFNSSVMMKNYFSYQCPTQFVLLSAF